MPYTPRFPNLLERYKRSQDTASFSDEELQMLDEILAGIIQHCTNYCGQSLLETEEVHTLDGTETRYSLPFTKVPVALVSQTSKADEFAAETPVTGQQYALDRIPGIVFLSFSGETEGKRLVKLRVGYTETTLPEDVQQFFTEALRIAWKESAKGDNRLGEQSVSQSFQGGTLTRVFSSLEKRKKAVLGPYKRPNL